MANQQEKKLIINRHTVWTIPNILTFFRILCVPVYMTLVILSSKAGITEATSNLYLFLGLGIMIFAALTDLIDGKIARKYKAGTKIGKHVVKYDQGTYVGQLIDPVADKIMHLGAIVALAVASYLHWAFLALLLFRELCMVIIASFIMNKVNVQANMLGKIASATISVGIILSFFHKFFMQLWGDYGIDWIIVTIGLVLNWIAAFKYGYKAYKDMQVYKANLAKKEEKLEEIADNENKEDK